ncbi:hypothetical protein BHM03_00050352, partial [Ensete ventricosum]
MAEKGSVIGCHTVAEWNRHLQLARESGKLVRFRLARPLCFYQTAASLVGSKDLSGLQVVVYFTSSWCGPCRMIAPVFADLANKFTDAIFLRVDVNELK